MTSLPPSSNTTSEFLVDQESLEEYRINSTHFDGFDGEMFVAETDDSLPHVPWYDLRAVRLAIWLFLGLLTVAVVYSQYLNSSDIEKAENIEQTRSAKAANPAASPDTTLAKSDIDPLAASLNVLYFEDCSAVAASGLTSLQKGDKGYREGLDSDRDGIACETIFRVPSTKSLPRSTQYEEVLEVTSGFGAAHNSIKKKTIPTESIFDKSTTSEELTDTSKDESEDATTSTDEVSTTDGRTDTSTEEELEDDEIELTTSTLSETVDETIKDEDGSPTSEEQPIEREPDDPLTPIDPIDANAETEELPTTAAPESTEEPEASPMETPITEPEEPAILIFPEDADQEVEIPIEIQDLFEDLETYFY